MKTYTPEQVAEHNSASNCWIIIEGKVFDVTQFLNEHPGGKKVLVKVAGKDASKQFQQFHNESIMQSVGLPMQIGVIGSAQDVPAPVETVTTAPIAAQTLTGEMAHFGNDLPYSEPSWYQEWNSPYYTESHVKLRKVIREFVDKEITPFCHGWSEAKQVPREITKRCAELGLLNVVSGLAIYPTIEPHLPYPLPAGIKMGEFDIFHEAICIDEFSRCGAGGVLWAIQGGLSIGMPPIVNFGSQEMIQKVVPACLSGDKFIALAITEPSAGSDVANLKTVAKDMGDHYLVNGQKKWITQGAYADFYTVACRTGGEGMGGVSLLLVERSMPGVSTRSMDVQGMWGSGTSVIIFEDVKVPKSNLIGELNKGFKYIMHNFNHERVSLVIQASRSARVCVEEAFQYALKRETFGQRLIDHAVIRNKLGHMIRQCEATHAWLESVLYQMNTLPKEVQADRLGGPIALLKVQSTQTFEFCAREAMHIFGGLAYTRGGQGEKVERLSREVRAYAIPGGSEEIMLDLSVRQAMKLIASKESKL
ncbi:acyl-CoA dehydrogenase/oxidase [Spinellus fusiger]|nr:acyl-CoA dehydrogenase/oxidase [Spinellus fusiger]